jgi:hypothetical protein
LEQGNLILNFDAHLLQTFTLRYAILNRDFTSYSVLSTRENHILIETNVQLVLLNWAVQTKRSLCLWSRQQFLAIKVHKMRLYSIAAVLQPPASLPCGLSYWTWQISNRHHMVSCVQIQLLNGYKSCKQHGSSHNTMLLALNTVSSICRYKYIYI